MVCSTQVERLCGCEKSRVIDEHGMQAFSLRHELSKLDPVERAVVSGRLQELQGKMRELPYNEGEIRDDSRLAWVFCTHPGLDAEDVAHEILSTNYLYSSTPYPSVIQERLRAAANMLHESYPSVHWSDVWTMIIKYGVPVVKLAQEGPEAQAAIPSTHQTPEGGQSKAWSDW
jgi:hypothetical protein